MADLTDTFYPAEGIVGYGTQWMIGDGASPESFEAVPFVTKITPGEMSTGIVEKTHLRSPNRHKEKKATIRDSGPFSIECIYTPGHESQSNAGGGAGAFASGGTCRMWRDVLELNMKLVLADGSPATELPFRGTITKWQIGEVTTEGIIPLMIEVTPLQDFSGDLP
jgi:hypothetical protein